MEITEPALIAELVTEISLLPKPPFAAYTRPVSYEALGYIGVVDEVGGRHTPSLTISVQYPELLTARLKFPLLPVVVSTRATPFIPSGNIPMHMLVSGAPPTDWTEPETVTDVAAYAVGFCDTVIPRYKMGVKSDTAMAITTDSRILAPRVMFFRG